MPPDTDAPSLRKLGLLKPTQSRLLPYPLSNMEVGSRGFPRNQQSSLSKPSVSFHDWRKGTHVWRPCHFVHVVSWGWGAGGLGWWGVAFQFTIDKKALPFLPWPLGIWALFVCQSEQQREIIGPENIIHKKKRTVTMCGCNPVSVCTPRAASAGNVVSC